MWEPMVVTTLRRYSARGASPGLLQRLAGGARDWRMLNEWWQLDGRLPPAAPCYDPIDFGPHAAPVLPQLSAPERRIMLVQLVADFAEANALFPSDGDLARYFGISASMIYLDFQALISQGKVASRMGSDGWRRTRRVLRLPGSEHSTADPHEMAEA